LARRHSAAAEEYSSVDGAVLRQWFTEQLAHGWKEVDATPAL
jgi:hypothetical protein